MSCEQDLAWNVLSSRKRENECLFVIFTALCLYAASKSVSHKAGSKKKPSCGSFTALSFAGICGYLVFVCLQ